ncbi:LysE family translocator [Trinickia caryophylli]|uniref:Threonine/homoserine/homoserine lactone efflux protein n=1 Tax=Trinickia caryophylli TaxID=28094 RepID=A0A1X7HBH0_TRICW|nr:LysE family translocator [Trinickia caryophylli]PMS08728.1 LysE family translocator [Trinickia caryophylli]TRX19007.1 LysE family translocator [Trinickia caryophylli]WQE10194.1 LysE family translocator [Trinickia caryophylli]SMF82639.1 Threonine/homoserine/homoserine lactone efflux protein [Trinickia caryophylli]GLU35844.1 lysine transporter LysE [Trinickia caryophylli]
MSFAQWLPFAIASAIVIVIPGPTVLLVVSYALGHGRRYALATTAGVALGDLTSMTASMLGLGAVLAASATLFTALKWVGAAYLVYLGIKLWRAPVREPQAPDVSETRTRKVVAHAYAVTTLNPKSIVFFVAFVPQFMNPHAPIWPQAVILEATFIVLASLNAFGYAVLASSARRAIRSRPVQRAVNRVGGTALVGAGVLAVSWKSANN